MNWINHKVGFILCSLSCKNYKPMTSGVPGLKLFKLFLLYQLRNVGEPIYLEWQFCSKLRSLYESTEQRYWLFSYSWLSLKYSILCRWIIDPPLDVTVPAKRTPWPDAPPELPTTEKLISIQENTEKRTTKPRSRRRSSRKKKHVARNIDIQTSSTRRSGEN